MKKDTTSPGECEVMPPPEAIRNFLIAKAESYRESFSRLEYLRGVDDLYELLVGYDEPFDEITAEKETTALVAGLGGKPGSRTHRHVMLGRRLQFRRDSAKVSAVRLELKRCRKEIFALAMLFLLTLGPVNFRVPHPSQVNNETSERSDNPEDDAES